MYILAVVGDNESAVGETAGLQRIQKMIEHLNSRGITPPYVIEHSFNWDIYLDADYTDPVTGQADATLRTMILKLPEIQDVRPRADLPNNTIMIKGKVDNL